MSASASRQSSRAATIAVLTLLAFGCTSAPLPTPSPEATPAPSPTAPSPSVPAPTSTPRATPPPKAVGQLDLESCDPEGLVPCEHMAAILSEPVAATGLSLTYSSEWADGRLDRPAWSAEPLGLGGWALDVLQRYDSEHGVLLGGDGSWRFVVPVEGADGEHLVPSFDARAIHVFDTAWRHVRTVDGITGATLLELGFDGEGRLESVAGHLPGGPVQLNVERDTDGVPTALTGLAGARTLLAIDGDGQLTLVARADGTTLSLMPGSFGLLAAWQQDGGGRTTFEYDEAGRLVSATDADGVVRRFAFEQEPDAVAVIATSAAGGTTTHRHRFEGSTLLRTYVTADGRLTELATEVDGSTRLTEANGTVTTVGSEAHPRWGDAAPVRSPYVETRPDGVAQTIEIGTTLRDGKDGEGGAPWRTEMSVDGQVWTDSYDPATRTLTRRDPEDRATAQVFDEQGRLVELHLPGQPATRYGYDDLGRLAFEEREMASGPATTSYAYDTDTGEVIVNRPDGTSERQLYDARGALIRSSTDEGETVSVVRNAAGQVMQVRYGAHPSTTLGFSPAGRPTAYLPPSVDGEASYETRSYDDDGRIMSVVGPGARSIAFTHDEAGRPVAWSFDRGETRADYEAGTGHLARLTTPEGLITDFSYAGQPAVGMAWSGPLNGRVALSLDGAGRQTAESVNGGESFAFEYDAGGALTSIDALAIGRQEASGLPASASLGAAQTEWLYDDAGLHAGSLTSVGGTVLLELRYARDALSRITRIDRRYAEGGETATEYGYDAAGRLMSVAVDGAAIETSTYDPAGNRSLVGGSDGELVASYDDRDRLLAWGDTTFDYEPDGTLAARTTPDGTTTYDYDDFGTLRSVDLPDGRQIEYLVDGLGRRVGRLVDGTLSAGYLFRPGGVIVAQTDAAGGIVARFAYDDLGRLIMVRRDGRDFLVTTDQLGSPLLIVDSQSGEVAQSITYDAWGQVMSDSNHSFTPFGFAGGLLDPDTSLVRFGARDYDPQTGRWTGPDPVRFEGGDANLYRYVGSDPVNRIDPSGLGHDPYIPPQDIVKALGDAPGEIPDSMLPERWLTPPAPAPAGPAPAAPSPGGGAQPGGSGGGICVGLCFPPGGGVCLGFCSFGEPHLRTGDGVAIGFQSAGEFTMSRSPDNSFVLQARQEPPGSRTDVTLTSGVAVLVAGDRVGFYADDERPLIVNGEVITEADVAMALPGGGIVERHGSEATIQWPDGSRLIVHLYGYFINYDLSPSDAMTSGLVGVLGGRDGDASNDLVSADGTVLDPDAADFFAQLHGSFADSWRITPADSLFDYLPGETTETFQRPEIPTAQVTLADIDETTRAAAESLCRATGVSAEPTLSECIFDVALTDDATFAGSAASVAAATAGAVAGPAGPATPVSIGEVVTGDVASADEIHRYSLTATGGEVVYIEAQPECVEGMLWRLRQPDGVPADVAAACNDLGREVLDQPGDWVIELNSDATAAGAYGFSVIGVPPLRETSITIGASVSDEIGAVGEWHHYRLTATGGEVVYIDALGECVDGLLWRLRRPAGDTADIGTLCIDIGREVLDQPGDWVIEVYSDVAATGAYGFNVIGAPPLRETSITIGASVADEIAAVGEWHHYRLTATGGEVVYIDALGECVDGLLWRLRRPAGDTADIGTLCIDIGREVLDQPGDWVIEVYSDVAATGAYSFSVTAAE